MAKKESTFFNMVSPLFLVTAIAATALGYVYEITKGPIEIAKKQKLENAIGEVVPEFDNLNTFSLMPKTGSDSVIFYEAIKGDELVGTAIKTYTDNGFSGKIWIIVGFDTKGTIINYKVLEHKETPGLGNKMEIWFNDKNKQDSYINGKNPGTSNFTVSKDGGDIDAITAATISSRAFLDAIQRAYDTFTDNKK
jgi:electron transport complex protein RnfG